jgi:hypothetical protein
MSDNSPAIYRRERSKNPISSAGTAENSRVVPNRLFRKAKIIVKILERRDKPRFEFSVEICV